MQIKLWHKQALKKSRMQVKLHFIIKLYASAVRLIHQAGSLHPEVSFIIGAASDLISASGMGSLTCLLTHCQSV